LEDEKVTTGQWQPLNSVSGRSYLFLVLSGLATGGSWICYSRALQLGDAARVAPVDKLSVVLFALFGVAFLRERLSVPNWVGVAFIAAGGVLLAHKG
jgi:bacterial/archaeal transporter family protein